MVLRAPAPPQHTHFFFKGIHFNSTNLVNSFPDEASITPTLVLTNYTKCINLGLLGNFFFTRHAAHPSPIPLFILLFLIIKTLSDCNYIIKPLTTICCFLLTKYVSNSEFGPIHQINFDGPPCPLPPSGNDIHFFSLLTR